MAIVFDSISIVGLRKAHLRQLVSYIDHCEQEGWYNEPESHFKSRHKDLKEWAKRAEEYAYSEGVRIPKK